MEIDHPNRWPKGSGGRLKQRPLAKAKYGRRKKAPKLQAWTFSPPIKELPRQRRRSVPLRMRGLILCDYRPGSHSLLARSLDHERLLLVARPLAFHEI